VTEQVDLATDVPPRPAGVPAGADWLPEVERWELAERGPGGEKHGEVRQWRADGTLYSRVPHRDGRPHGAFALFHPNGQVSREGAYREGEIDGLVTARGCDEESPEVLRSCCVPANAWEMRTRFRQGQLQNETFFDREGFPLLSDGSRRPDRPAGVPAEAEFDEFNGRWGAGATEENGTWLGRWRFWTVEGRLDEEAEYQGSRKTWSRLYDERGEVRHEVSYEGDGVHHGPYRRRFVEPGERPYADERVVEERGGFEHGHPVGRWSFFDASGALVRTLELGTATLEDEVPGRAVFANEPRSAAGWWQMAQALRTEGHLREALCAAARSAAQSGSPDALRGLLAETTVALHEEASVRALSGLAEERGTVPRALSALVGGADPAAVLRTLASVLKRAPRASADLVEAAILLAPERRMAFMTRALLRIELGDPDGARADADRVEPEASEAASFLRTYSRLLFPTFDFWPGREAPESALEELPDAPVQPLDAVRRTIQVYASRLAFVRATLEARVPGAPWLPPALPELLPEGPVELRAYDAEIVDETDQGPEASTVRVDETLALADWTVPGLMRLARSHWSALCWLCWSAGLDRVALPEALDPPGDFARAAGMSITRYWRAQDAVVTGGLRSLTAGVPGFVWEELEIDGIPRHFAEMAQEQYLEMRSVFLFLMSPENVSPFQADLRVA
jgi:antitoxin component YwqK of YwqJK toxin-antitoxin module